MSDTVGHVMHNVQCANNNVTIANSKGALTKAQEAEYISWSTLKDGVCDNKVFISCVGDRCSPVTPTRTDSLTLY